jgi:parallel beta-helix repeat protein
MSKGFFCLAGSEQDVLDDEMMNEWQVLNHEERRRQLFPWISSSFLPHSNSIKERCLMKNGLRIAFLVLAFLVLFTPSVGADTIPLEPTTNQSVIDEAIFLVNQYGGLANSIDEWMDSDSLAQLTGPTFNHLGTAIATYAYVNEMSEAFDCGEPGKPACDDTAAIWMQVADKAGSLALDQFKEWGISKAQDYVFDTLFWQGASNTVGMVTKPAEACYQVVKSVIDTVDGQNIRNRMAFYLQFKEKFPSDSDPLPLQRVLTEHEDPRNIPGFSAEQEVFLLSFFTGYLTGRIVNESVNMIANCYEPAKNLWEMKENARILASGFDPEESGKKLADEILRMDRAIEDYVQRLDAPKIRIIHSGTTMTVQNIGEEDLASVYIRETSFRNSETLKADIPAGGLHTFDLSPLGDDPAEEIVFNLFNKTYSRPLSELGQQDVLPVIEITDISNDGIFPTTIQANARQTVLAQGLTPSYTWAIAGFEQTGPDLTYTFEDSGYYEIILTVSAGGSDYSISEFFTVKTDPALRPVIETFTVSNELPDKGEMLHLEVSATDPVGMGLSYEWYESDRFTGEKTLIGTARALDVVFSGGYREYSLKVVNAHGSDRDEVLVMEAGEWNINASGADWIGDATITFSAVGGNPSGATFEWSFSDGGSGSGETLDHYFSASGTYTATLKVHKNGSITEVSKEIRLVDETEIPWQVGEPDSANITGKGADYLTVSLNPPAGSFSQVLVVARAAGEPVWTPQNGQTYSQTGWMGDGSDRLAGITTSMTSITAGGLNKVGARWFVRVWYRYYENSTYKYRMGEGAEGVTALWGTITSDLTLDISGSPYVLSDNLKIATGAKLNILSGVIIKAKGGRIIVQGELNASGAVFTSHIDDMAGGDTNGDGFATIPTGGNWYGILFESGSSGVLDGVRISYGHHSYYSGSYWYGGQVSIVGTDNVLIKNSVIRNGGNDGIYILDASPEIRNCLISSHVYLYDGAWGGNGIYIKNSGSTIVGNEVTGNGDAGIYLQNSPSASVSGNSAIGNGLDENSSSWKYKGIYATDSIDALSSGNEFSEMIFLNGGILTKDANWNKNTQWVIKSTITIGQNTKLFIEEGAAVKALGGRIIVQGELNASGTTFTSGFDDKVWGDTNKDDSDTLPSGGNWHGILFESGSKGVLDGVRISYGHHSYCSGSYWYGGQVSIVGTDNVLIKNCVIRNGGNDGIYILNASPEIRNCLISDHVYLYDGAWGGNGIYMKNSGATVVGNEVTGNDYAGIYIANSTNSILIRNKIYNNNLKDSNWTYEGIYADNSANLILSSNEGTDLIYLSGGTITSPRFWDNKQPWVLSSNLTISSAGKLTIPTGTVVKCKSSSILVEGTLNAENAFFTSYKDDTIAGDTNADADQTAPAPGDWRAIVYKSGSSGTIDNVTVRYGDDAYVDSRTYSGQLVILSDNVTVKNSLFQFGDRAGIYVENAVPALTKNRLFSNYNGMYIKNTALPVHTNTFAGNSNYGLYNVSSGYTVDATDNFWGDPTGPQHASNPGGLGDKVSDYVIFSSWQTSEYTLADAIVILQLLCGIQTDYLPNVDINMDTQIGLPEAVYVLQKTANLR